MDYKEWILGLRKPKPPIKSGTRLSYPRMTKKKEEWYKKCQVVRMAH
jgi:hypothetical protein